MEDLILVVSTLAHKAQAKEMLEETKKCDELAFYDLNHLPNNMILYIRQALEHYQNHIPFSIYGW